MMQPHRLDMGAPLTPEQQAAYDASVEQLVGQVFAIPGVEAAVIERAEKEFLEKYGAAAVGGAVALLLAGVLIGRATK